MTNTKWYLFFQPIKLLPADLYRHQAKASYIIWWNLFEIMLLTKCIHPNSLLFLIDQGHILGREGLHLTTGQVSQRDFCRANEPEKQYLSKWILAAGWRQLLEKNNKDEYLKETIGRMLWIYILWNTYQSRTLHTLTTWGNWTQCLWL